MASDITSIKLPRTVKDKELVLSVPMSHLKRAALGALVAFTALFVIIRIFPQLNISYFSFSDGFTSYNVANSVAINLGVILAIPMALIFDSLVSRAAGKDTMVLCVKFANEVIMPAVEGNEYFAKHYDADRFAKMVFDGEGLISQSWNREGKNGEPTHYEVWFKDNTITLITTLESDAEGMAARELKPVKV